MFELKPKCLGDVFLQKLKQSLYPIILQACFNSKSLAEYDAHHRDLSYVCNYGRPSTSQLEDYTTREMREKRRNLYMATVAKPAKKVNLSKKGNKTATIPSASDQALRAYHNAHWDMKNGQSYLHEPWDAKAGGRYVSALTKAAKIAKQQQWEEESGIQQPVH